MLLSEAQVQEMEADRRAGLNIRKTAQDGLIADWRALRRVVEAAREICDRYGPTHDEHSNQWINALDDALATLEPSEAGG